MIGQSKVKSFFRTVNLAALILVAGLLVGFAAGCKQSFEPTAETKIEKVTITVKGDSNVKVNAPTTFEAKKGSSWGEIKANAQVTYNENYGAAGFRLNGESGDDLADDYVFNESKTVFAVSKLQSLKVTVNGDERTVVSSDNTIKIDYAKTWQQIKDLVQGKVSLHSDWQGGDYEFYEWRLGDENGEKLTDNYAITENVTIYAITNYAKFNIIDNAIKLTSERSGEGTGYKGDQPKGKIIIPEGITEICDYAFLECNGLTSVDLSGCTSLTVIGGCAFYKCQNLTSVKFPESVTKIGRRAFSECSKLVSVTFAKPDGWVVYNDGNYLTKCADISSEDLSKSEVAAKYLRVLSSNGGYCEKNWKKN